MQNHGRDNEDLMKYSQKRIFYKDLYSINIPCLVVLLGALMDLLLFKVLINSLMQYRVSIFKAGDDPLEN